jgi:hypothetical protein
MGVVGGAVWPFCGGVVCGGMDAVVFGTPASPAELACGAVITVFAALEPASEAAFAGVLGAPAAPDTPASGCCCSGARATPLLGGAALESTLFFGAEPLGASGIHGD